MVDILDSNLKEINTLIQRGERMLSLVDLIKRNTLSLGLAAYFINGMRNGASVLIGARPGRAGKTTMMGALLGIIPSSDRIIAVKYVGLTKGLTPGTQKSPKTYVIHEISNHGPTYLWGPAVVEVTRLVGPHTRLASNLHEDNIAGVKATFRRCGSEEAMNVFDLIIFIQYASRDAHRAVGEVWEFDRSNQSFNLTYSDVEGFSPHIANSANHRKWETFLSQCINQDVNTIEGVAYALKKYAKE